jgi:hypothetical protein
LELNHNCSRTVKEAAGTALTVCLSYSQGLDREEALGLRDWMEAFENFEL